MKNSVNAAALAIAKSDNFILVAIRENVARIKQLETKRRVTNDSRDVIKKLKAAMDVQVALLSLHRQSQNTMRIIKEAL